jgi:hypothetical protein
MVSTYRKKYIACDENRSHFNHYLFKTIVKSGLYIHIMIYDTSIENILFISFQNQIQVIFKIYVIKSYVHLVCLQAMRKSEDNLCINTPIKQEVHI